MHLSLDQGPVLLFGGPYGNLQATKALCAVAEDKGIATNNIICNGDLVAYCAEPNETISFIRNWGIHIVMGNCEESIGNQSEDCGCGFDEGSTCSLLSVEWYRYVTKNVTQENARWMKTLPRKLSFSLGDTKFCVIHGGVTNISEFVFASSDMEKKRLDIHSENADCIVGGHCGIPFGQQITDNANHQQQSLYWLNTGVIGMPANDGTKDGWYLIIEMKNNQLIACWNRLTYAASEASEKMVSANLCQPYQQALISGLWPSMDVLPEIEKAQQGQPLSIPSLAIL